MAVVDSGSFKGKEEIDALKTHTGEDLAKYVDLARRMGFAADSVYSIGIEVVAQASDLCEQVAKLYPKATIFTGKLVFRRERFFYGILHNETSKIIQRPPAMGGRADGGAADPGPGVGGQGGRRAFGWGKPWAPTSRFTPTQGRFTLRANQFTPGANLHEMWTARPTTRARRRGPSCQRPPASAGWSGSWCRASAPRRPRRDSGG